MGKTPAKTKVQTTKKTKPKPKTAPKKPPAKPKQGAAKKKTAVKKVRKTLEKNEIIAIDLCGVKLTNIQLNFIVNYVTPGQPCFHNALQAAIKAGYSENVAKVGIYGFLRRQDIQKIIRANERLIHDRIHSSAVRALELKQERAFFDVNDYFQEKEITVTTKEGEYTKPVMALKPLEEMTAEQRRCIDGIDIKGQASIPVYLMPDRGRELNDIIKIDSETSKGAAGTGEEETREIIMERVTIRETRRAKSPADIEYEIVEKGEGG